MAIPTCITGFVALVLCIVIGQIMRYAPNLVVNCCILLVMYGIAAPLCIHGTIKERGASRVFGIIGFGLIVIITIAAIIVMNRR